LGENAKLHQKGSAQSALVLILVLVSLLLAACGSSASSSVAEPASETPEWFDIELTNVQTGETFTMNDYAGKVLCCWKPWRCGVLIVLSRPTKSEKCELLGNPEDLVSISLDVDVNEDAASLKQYAEEYRLEWHFALRSLRSLVPSGICILPNT